MSSPIKEVAHFSVTMENFTIEAELQRMTTDILIILTGGNVPHIGSVTTLSDGNTTTINFICHNGKPHKDHILAEKIMGIIEPFVSGNCVITSGIHVDYITKQQIIASSTMAEAIAEQIMTWLQQNPLSETIPLYYE